MKIKTKKKMTPEEYAKYMIDKHGIRGYESKLIDNYLPGAPERFSQKFELNPTLKEDVLTGSFRNGELEVEIEEEITEDTVLDKLVEVYGDDDFIWRATDWKEASIRYILATNEDNTRTETIHLINDDGTHTLIWRDGKMVE